jgi:hypothetical protein
MATKACRDAESCRGFKVSFGNSSVRRIHDNKNQPNSIMSTTSDNGFMLIFRGTDWYRGLSPEQMQQVFDQWMAWFNGLKEQGTAIAGNPLEPQGKLVAGPNGRLVSDGPFAESKETIGGYFLLSVGTMDEAVRIAQDCPGLPYGIRVEVRPVAPECPLAQERKTETQFAQA